MNAENFINYLGIGCTVLGGSLFSLISIFGKQIKFPCSSNLYRELEQHNLRILWVGKDVDKYIRWIRVHILLYIALSMSAVAATLVLVVLEESNVVLSFFFPMILISGVFVSFSERSQNGESFSAQEKTVLIGSYVFGSSVFTIVFSTIESVESRSMQVIYFMLILGIIFVLYQIPLTYYKDLDFIYTYVIRVILLMIFSLYGFIGIYRSMKRFERSKLPCVDYPRVEGEKGNYFEIRLKNGKILSSKEQFFYPVSHEKGILLLFLDGTSRIVSGSALEDPKNPVVVHSSIQGVQDIIL